MFFDTDTKLLDDRARRAVVGVRIEEHADREALVHTEECGPELEALLEHGFAVGVIQLEAWLEPRVELPPAGVLVQWNSSMIASCTSIPLGSCGII